MADYHFFPTSIMVMEVLMKVLRLPIFFYVSISSFQIAWQGFMLVAHLHIESENDEQRYGFPISF